MKTLDSTYEALTKYLQQTENVMNRLLYDVPFCGKAKIIPNYDLGFPHDVIRIAGGFATGIYVSWNTCVPFIPVDICMNVCSVSIYKLEYTNCDFFTESGIQKLIDKMRGSSYIANFQRGNHFISLVESLRDGKLYIIIHSSAAEFETQYNGLYPVEGNYFFNKVKVYRSGGRYIRYIMGSDAELFYEIAGHLFVYNEIRHDFIVNSLIDSSNSCSSVSHYHHYGMPTDHEAVIGCHLQTSGEKRPLLTRPGENIYLLRYNSRTDNNAVNQLQFTTPHGLGKMHIKVPLIHLGQNTFELDNTKYKIRYGESLRNHPNLQLRTLPIIDYMNQMKEHYDYSIDDEYRQLKSFNKDGFIDWRMCYEK